MPPSMVWDAFKATLQGKAMSIEAGQVRERKLVENDLTMKFQALEAEDKQKLIRKAKHHLARPQGLTDWRLKGEP